MPYSKFLVPPYRTWDAELSPTPGPIQLWCWSAFQPAIEPHIKHNQELSRCGHISQHHIIASSIVLNRSPSFWVLTLIKGHSIWKSYILHMWFFGDSFRSLCATFRTSLDKSELCWPPGLRKWRWTDWDSRWISVKFINGWYFLLVYVWYLIQYILWQLKLKKKGHKQWKEHKVRTK